MKNQLHIAHFGLLDAAPLLVAQERGYFASEGLEVRLSCELGLASICGKLVDRRLDGACLPAPLPVLLSLGAGMPRVPMQVVQVCARQGWGFVLATTKQAARTGGGAAPAARLGVITPGAPTRLLLQRLQHLSPDLLSAEITQVPMAASQLIDFLREGMLDGFCGIDPLPALARTLGLARIAADSAALFPMHPGGVLALHSDLVEGGTRSLTALDRAVRRGREFCAAAANRAEVWRLLLAQGPYAGIGAETRAALAGIEAAGAGVSMRFDGRGGIAGDDISFLDAACRGAIGQSSRGLDVKAEIPRVFAPCIAAAPENVAKM